MKALLIFDLDGTLVNSVYDLADAVNDALQAHGYPKHDVDEYYYFVGNGTVKLCERALPEHERTQENIMRLHSEFAENYNRCCLNKTAAYDGMTETLARLKEQGYRLAVASNKTDVFSRHIVSSIFGKDTFDVVAGKKDGVPTKPDPAIINGIVSQIGCTKAEAILIGDSNVDVATAKNAGIKCIGCEWGFRGRAELEAAGADFIAGKPSDILDIVGNL